MKKCSLTITMLLILSVLLSFAGVSFAWLCFRNIIIPDSSFSAGSPDEYVIYEITCEDTSSMHSIREVGSIGTEGFSVSDLQLGKINNLSTLANSNYIYYAIRIPKDHGGSVSIGISYGDTDSDGNHFKIYVPIKDGNGKITYDAQGEINTVLFDDQSVLTSIKAIETSNDSTFLKYALALSPVAPHEYASIEGLKALFSSVEAENMNSIDNTGAPIAQNIHFDISSVTGDYYYAYIRLDPNISLYKDFIDYLWNNMPFFLAYEIRVTLEVTP